MPWREEPAKSAYACNPELFKYLREQRGMTQIDLAVASGYSERLIRKAEGGRSISQEALEILAEALSTESKPVFPEDLVSDPVLLAKQYMHALFTAQAETIQACRHFFDENVVFIVHGDPKEIPFAGTFHGIDAIDHVFREIFFKCIEVPDGYDHMALCHFVGQGTDVVVWGDSWIHPIGQPMERPMPISHLLRFRRGKLILFDNRFDTQYAAQILEK